jgi:hypothetical protein
MEIQRAHHTCGQHGLGSINGAGAARQLQIGLKQLVATNSLSPYRVAQTWSTSRTY